MQLSIERKTKKGCQIHSVTLSVDDTNNGNAPLFTPVNNYSYGL